MDFAELFRQMRMQGQDGPPPGVASDRPGVAPLIPRNRYKAPEPPDAWARHREMFGEAGWPRWDRAGEAKGDADAAPGQAKGAAGGVFAGKGPGDMPVPQPPAMPSGRAGFVADWTPAPAAPTVAGAPVRDVAAQPPPGLAKGESMLPPGVSKPGPTDPALDRQKAQQALLQEQLRGLGPTPEEPWAKYGLMVYRGGGGGRLTYPDNIEIQKEAKHAGIFGDYYRAMDQRAKDMESIFKAHGTAPDYIKAQAQVEGAKATAEGQRLSREDQRLGSRDAFIGQAMAANPNMPAKALDAMLSKYDALQDISRVNRADLPPGLGGQGPPPGVGGPPVVPPRGPKLTSQQQLEQSDKRLRDEMAKIADPGLLQKAKELVGGTSYTPDALADMLGNHAPLYEDEAAFRDILQALKNKAGTSSRNPVSQKLYEAMAKLAAKSNLPMDRSGTGKHLHRGTQDLGSGVKVTRDPGTFYDTFLTPDQAGDGNRYWNNSVFSPIVKPLSQSGQQENATKAKAMARYYAALEAALLGQ